MKRAATGVLAALLALAIGACGWYFSTQAPQRGSKVFERRHAIGVPPVAWRAASKSERARAIAAIQAQLDAFKKNDYQAAAKYQSQALKTNFVSIEKFRDMIQGSYPEFAHPKRARYGAARATADGKIVAVPLVLQGQNGKTVRAEYAMILESGSYRVSGVSGGQSLRKKPSAPGKNFPPSLKKLEPLIT